MAFRGLKMRPLSVATTSAPIIAARTTDASAPVISTKATRKMKATIKAVLLFKNEVSKASAATMTIETL